MDSSNPHQNFKPVDTPLLEALLRCPFPCSNFTGRDTVLDVMKNHLLNSYAGLKVHALCGPPGIGKSQIAIAFAKTHSRQFSAVMYANVITQKDIYDQLRKEAWLRDSRGWLMIIDNLDSAEDARKYLSLWKHGGLILTVRAQSEEFSRVITREIRGSEYTMVIPTRQLPLKPDMALWMSNQVQGLTMPCPMSLLAAILGLKFRWKAGFAELTLQKLLQEWGNSPLIVLQLGNHIRNSSQSLDEYCTRYASNPEELLEALLLMPSPPGYISEPPAVYLQKLASQLDPQTAEIFEFWATLRQNGFMSELPLTDLLKSYTLSLETFCEAIFCEKPPYLHGTIPTSSIFLPFDKSTQNKFVGMALLSAQIWPYPSLWDTWASGRVPTGIRSLTGVLFLFSKVSLDSSLAPFLISWANQIISQISDTDQPFIECSARMFDRCGWWLLSQKLWLQKVQYQISALGLGHPDTLSSMAELANSYKKLGLLAAAKGIQNVVLKKRQQILGEDHLNTLSIMHDLAVTLLACGQTENAEAQLQRVLQSRTIRLGVDHPDTLSTRHSLVLVYCEQRRWQDAIDLNQSVLDSRRQVLGEEHPETLSSLYNVILIKLGEDQLNVMEWGVGFLEDDKLTYPERIWKTSREFDKIGDYPTPRQVLKAREKILGVNHPDTLSIMLVIATICQIKGQWGKATKIRIRVLEIRKQLFGSDHPMTLSTMIELASWFETQGYRARGIALREEVLNLRVELHGKGDHDAIHAATALVSSYWDEGRWKEAEILHQDLVQTQKQTLGDDHSDTLESTLNLADRYLQQCRWQEASELLVDALEGIKMSLGLDHYVARSVETKLKNTQANLLNDVLEITPKVPSELIVAYFVRKCGIHDYTTELARAPYCSEHPVTNGGLSDIFRAKLEDDTQVAVKCVRLTHSEYKRVKHTIQEMSAWSKIDHENVVPFLGLAVFRDQLAMLSPWCNVGNVMKTIGRYSFATRFHLCMQLVGVVVYLHDNDIVHGDLKGENILISDGDVIQLTDFGLTIVHDENIKFSKSGGGKGTTRWMAPELLLDEAHVSKETDVYAFGMTMLELLTGNQPFHEIINDFGVILAIGAGKRPERPGVLSEDKPPGEACWYILQKCWKQEPSSRPSSQEVLSMMKVLNG